MICICCCPAPSSVTYGDSFPRLGEAFRANHTVIPSSGAVRHLIPKWKAFAPANIHINSKAAVAPNAVQQPLCLFFRTPANAKKHPANRFRSAGCLALIVYGSAYAAQHREEITPQCSRTGGTSSRTGCAKCPSEKSSAARTRCSKQRGCSPYPPSGCPQPYAAVQSAR